MSVLIGEEWPILLDHSLQTSLFEVLSGCLWVEGVANDGDELFCDIHSCFSLLGVNKVSGMADVDIRKLEWMATCRKVFVVYFGDCGGQNIKGTVDRLSRMACCKKGTDGSNKVCCQPSLHHETTPSGFMM